MSVSAVLLGIAAWNLSRESSLAAANQAPVSSASAATDSLRVPKIPQTDRAHWFQVLADAARNDGGPSHPALPEKNEANEDKEDKEDKNISFPNTKPASFINVALEEEK
jgi:hypothetical protein